METNSQLIQKIEAYVKPVFSSTNPGAAILISKNGNNIFRKSYGMAHMELEIPVEPHMVFRIGSITKQFTAICILILYEKGKIDLNADINNYIDNFSSGNRKITVEHLLTHTSGIPNYTDLPEFRKNIRNDITLQERIASIKNLPLEFDPGGKFNYSNSGYFLLGVIIENVSGMTYSDFLQEHIFIPLGMSHTSCEISDRITPGRVSGYAYKDGEFKNAAYISMTQPYAAGALVSCVDDLFLFANALYNNTLIKPETFSLALKSTFLTNGDSTDYGYGWVNYTYNDISFHGHDGGIDGFSCSNLYIPSEKVYIVMLVNCENPKIFPEKMVRDLAGITIGKQAIEPIIIAIDDDVLDEYVGVYKISDTEVRSITRQGKQCFSQRGDGPKLKIFPYEKDAFLLREVSDRFFFKRDETGFVIGMKVVRLVGPPEHCTKIS
jgi:CubicO group peptidase (beta-lactamase class C family)